MDTITNIIVVDIFQVASLYCVYVLAVLALISVHALGGVASLYANYRQEAVSREWDERMVSQ